MYKVPIGKMGLVSILALSLSACEKNLSSTEGNAAGVPGAAFKSNTSNPEGIIFYALRENNLDKYATSSPEDLISTAAISGLQPGERVLALDFRPRTGQLYALGSNSRVYIVNPQSGAATFAFSFRSNTNGMQVLLSGTSFGFDFNPQVDRLRIISNNGQNLRIVPDNAAVGVAGTTFTDNPINPQPASVNGVAYDNNFAGTTSTELYALETITDQLFEVNPPNSGRLVDGMRVKIKLEGEGGFDIAPRNEKVTTDIGLALYEVDNKSALFEVNLETGQYRTLAKYPKEIRYTAIAISPAF